MIAKVLVTPEKCPGKCDRTDQANVIALTRQCDRNRTDQVKRSQPVIQEEEEKAEQCAGKEYQKLAQNIRETIAEIVPKKKNQFKNGRSISEDTKQLYKDRIKEYSKGKPTKEKRNEWNKKIKNADKNDYRRWVSRWTEEIERANGKGDLKAVYRGVRAVSGAKDASQPLNQR